MDRTHKNEEYVEIVEEPCVPMSVSCSAIAAADTSTMSIDLNVSGGRMGGTGAGLPFAGFCFCTCA